MENSAWPLSRTRGEGSDEHRYGKLWWTIVTAGGVVFIGATNYDKKFRALDKSTGELLWETTLPFSGNATPATYMVKGVNSCHCAGGGKDPKSNPAEFMLRRTSIAAEKATPNK